MGIERWKSAVFSRQLASAQRSEDGSSIGILSNRSAVKPGYQY